MLSLPDFLTGIGSAIFAAVVAWKLIDILIDKDLRNLIWNMFRSKRLNEFSKVYLQVIEKILMSSLYGEERILKVFTVYLNSSLVRSIASISKQIIDATPEEKKC